MPEDKKIHRLDRIKTFNDPYADVFVDVTSPGRPLRCSFHRGDSCMHVAKVLRDNNDAEQLWSVGVPDEMLIPVMPSNDVREMVRLAPIDDGAQMYRVEWVWKKEIIGFITPGDGRMAIRQMLINALEVATAGIDKCLAVQHSVGAERAWKMNRKDVALSFLDLWMVLKNNHCKFCHTVMADRNRIYTSDEDLIPKEEPTSRSGWARIEKAKEIEKERRLKLKTLAEPRKDFKSREESPLVKAVAEAVSRYDKDFTPKFTTPSPKDTATDDIF